jgi:excisionase family DNA binding protein
LLITVNELSDILKVHKNTIYNWLRQDMPHYKNGKTIRFDLEQVKEWLQSR